MNVGVNKKINSLVSFVVFFVSEINARTIKKKVLVMYHCREHVANGGSGGEGHPPLIFRDGDQIVLYLDPPMKLKAIFEKWFLTSPNY